MSGSADGAVDGGMVDGGTIDGSNMDGSKADASTAPPSSLRLIDDMEHNDATFPGVPPGSSSFFWKHGLGNWFVTSSGGMSGDAQIDDIVPPSPYGQKACHVTGGSSPATRVDLWAQLDHPAGMPVNLDAYIGIAFRARLRSTTGRLTVALNDVAGGNFFAAEASAAPWPARTVTPSDWERVVVLFEDFSTAPTTTAGTAPGRSPRVSNITSIDFVVGDGTEPFDLWLDELALVCKGPCAP